MGFFKNLFSKDETFVPAPTQNIPGLEPIVVQAVENLFPNIEDQKELFNGLLEHSKNASSLMMLALLSISGSEIDVESAKKYVIQNTSSPIDGTNTEYFISRDSGFFKMKDAEKWVKSITKPQA